MSTAYQRRAPDGTKAKTFTVDIWINGRKFPRATGKRTRREAEREAVRIEEELRKELARQYEPLTVDSCLDKYWDEHASKIASGKRTVKSLIKTLVTTLGPALPFAELSNKHVNGYVQKREKTGVARRTINRELDVLYSAYRKARDSWEHPVRPINFKDHRFPKDDRAPTIWTPEEARRAIELMTPKSKDVADGIELSIYTGMRQNELKTLIPARVNLAERFATVLAKRKARQDYRERRVYLNTPAVALLAERIQPGMDPDRPIFQLVNLRKLWEWVRAEIGRPEVRWHDLRHTHGTILGKTTKDTRIIQTTLGHAHLQTAMIYVHTDHAAAVEAVETIPALSERKVVQLYPNAETEAQPPSSATHTGESSEKSA